MWWWESLYEEIWIFVFGRSEVEEEEVYQKFLSIVIYNRNN